MASIFDVAKYLLIEMEPMSTWKLHKLCYYSQAWSIAWGDGELFPEDFEAWSNGPVCPELFKKHKGMFTISDKNFKHGDVNALTSQQKENIGIIIRDYGDKEPYWLREQTHIEAPWRDARNGLPDGAPSSALISKESMGEYYGSL
jgi:uncharacterized phage-associated protein